MDDQRFDALTRHLGRLANRRSLLGASLALLGRSALPESALACKKVGRKCDKNKACCDHAKCKGDKKDQKGKCRCKSGYKECNKRCYDLDKDRQNCGACGNACLTPEACCDGECSTACAQ
jgi:hypothetical protein